MTFDFMKNSSFKASLTDIRDAFQVKGFPALQVFMKISSDENKRIRNLKTQKSLKSKQLLSFGAHRFFNSLPARKYFANIKNIFVERSLFYQLFFLLFQLCNIRFSEAMRWRQRGEGSVFVICCATKKACYVNVIESGNKGKLLCNMSLSRK